MNVIWATRGQSWGFRFLLDGGFVDPLPTYEHAFAGTAGDTTVWRRDGATVALRFADPAGRRDGAGRAIRHDVVVLSPLAADIESLAEGQRLVWPHLSVAFDRLWELPKAPSPSDIRRAFTDHAVG